ncbi:MAG TPA: LacI family DNA-binding transcriptional regulator, partial [Cellulomonas sp.]|nr:LacI family DNA-binding transcriptional regulator [Cellulomonas sp.]
MSTVPTRRKRATIRDVAVEAGVSRGTVSRVVNNEPYVSAQARTAIESAIARVGYVPNTAARNLVMQRSQAVGFIVHEPHSLFLEDPNIGAILLGANNALSRADYQMVCLIIDSERDSDRVARYLSGGFVDGVIIVSARQNDPITRVLERLALPATFVGHPPDLRQGRFVGIDNRRSARAITERLMATGRRRIGMIAAALDRDSGADRLAGFTDALGSRFDPALVASVPLYEFSAGLDGMRALLERAPDIDGVFAASDAVAVGALEALREAGRSVPGDVGIVG